MEIKDISIAAKLDDVRGGQDINVNQVGLQAGLNFAASGASGWGVGNTTVSDVSQKAGQSMQQGTFIDAAEIYSRSSTISGSVVDFGFPSVKSLL